MKRVGHGYEKGGVLFMKRVGHGYEAGGALGKKSA